MSPHVMYLVEVAWAVAFSFTMGWVAAVFGSSDEDWYKES